MSASEYFTVKHARISNNCPECYSNDSLEITFKQKRIETKLYKTITKEIIGEIYCLNCKFQIFPIRWTDDIDRVVEYYKRKIDTMASSTKLKPRAWLLIGLSGLCLCLGLLWMVGLFSH